MFDLLFKNVVIYDGTGAPPIHGDVAVKSGRICRVGRNLIGGRQVVDGGGLALAPGFIDAHSHSDTILDLDPTSFGKLEQGVTTEVAGCCGMSPAPLSEAYFEEGFRTFTRVREYTFDPDRRRTFGAYLRDIDRALGTNTAFQIGHGTVRAAVSGLANRPLTAAEMNRMKEHLEEAMEAGAMGVSFGLVYPPGAYSDEEELVEVCRTVAKHGGVFSIHMRSEGAGVIESVKEVIRLVKQTGIRAVISHHKVSDRAHWGKTVETLALVDEAVAQGYDIFFDQYPYNASSTVLSSTIPPSFLALGVQGLVEKLDDPDGRREIREQTARKMNAAPDALAAAIDYVMLADSPSHPDYSGRMLSELAEEMNIDAFELLMDILRDDRLMTAAIYFKIGDEDIVRVMRHPRTMIGTDGLYAPGARSCHPRAFGSFPRVLGKYVREEKVLTLEEAIRKMTSMPAMVYGLAGKGLIREGFDADLVVFDPLRIIDKADYQDYRARCEGLNAVYIAGRQVVENACHNGRMEGRVILR